MERKIAEETGTPFNRVAYEKETAREEAARKKALEAKKAVMPEAAGESGAPAARALVAYVAYAGSLLELSWARFVLGLENGAGFIGRMLRRTPPPTS